MDKEENLKNYLKDSMNKKRTLFQLNNIKMRQKMKDIISNKRRSNSVTTEIPNQIQSTIYSEFPENKNKFIYTPREISKKKFEGQVDKEIEELMADVGITKRYLLESTKSVVDKVEVRDGDKLRALETLMKISGMLNTDKKSESIALIQEFTGFSKEKLQAFEQGMLTGKKKELTSGNTSSSS